MKLTEKTLEAFNYIKNHGGSCKTTEIMEGLGLDNINKVTGRINSLVNKELAYREDGGRDENDRKITIVTLTDMGMNFVPSDDDE